MKTGTEVFKLGDGRYGVDLLDGRIAVFTEKEHAEEYIVQQNTVFVFGNRPEKKDA